MNEKNIQYLERKFLNKRIVKLQGQVLEVIKIDFAPKDNDLYGKDTYRFWCLYLGHFDTEQFDLTYPDVKDWMDTAFQSSVNFKLLYDIHNNLFEESLPSNEAEKIKAYLEKRFIGKTIEFMSGTIMNVRDVSIGNNDNSYVKITGLNFIISGEMDNEFSQGDFTTTEIKTWGRTMFNAYFEFLIDL